MRKSGTGRSRTGTMGKPEDTIRLNRFLARAGLGSRRAVEDLIRQGRVRVNGQNVADLGRQVNPHADRIEVDGVPARLPEDYRIYAFHKPLGVVSTLKAQGGQPSLDRYRLQSDLPERFVPIGRLDSESTGLLLWTDDGQLNPAPVLPKEEDDLMCWAAAASNVLEWTGWGVVGGMTNTDEMFQHFQDHWTDLGGSSEYAWNWWFDGTVVCPFPW